MTQSKVYFAEVAEEWDEIRSVYFTEAMRDAAVQKANLPVQAAVADIGTGTGFMIQGLLDKSSALVGFDESPEMLAVARNNFANYPHVRFELANGLRLPEADNRFDAVFANMFLHHAPDPAAVIIEMVRILKPGGKLIITDLDSHDQAWMREAMADRWLGFERQDIQEWYAKAGLVGIDIDCAEGTCDCSAPDNEAISLSIFVAIGQKLQ
ncbi:MAG: class I SAM-dependent methyltransferase [Candidatus Promineifilaceae bacterium]|nr:class I SAM-dependent methyltransferase [Candidatus Promineifilaceae bacterium]